MADMRMRMRVVMGVFAQRAALAPHAVAIDIVLLLPDRAAVLDRLHHLPTGAEGLVAMRGAGGHHHRKIAQTQPALGVADVELEFAAEIGLRLARQLAEAAEHQNLTETIHGAAP